MASAKRSYKAQYQGKENEEGKRKDGKRTSESGQVSTSTAVREQPKAVRDGRRLSPMAEDCHVSEHCRNITVGNVERISSFWVI